jgi:hypothetical protein
MVHGGHQNRKWKYLLNGIGLQPDSHGYTHICDQAGLICDTVDIARRWLVSRTQDGGHHFLISVVGRRRKMSTESYPRRIWPKIWGLSWNRGAISHRWKDISNSDLVVAILANVGQCRDVSSIVANVQLGSRPAVNWNRVCQLIAFRSYFHFRFRWPPFWIM